MKDKIRQILRQFIPMSEYNDDKLLNALRQFMNYQIKDYFWYTDTPENRFESKPESIWLINPKTEEWAVELKKDGWMWWNIDFYLNFQRYFNMEVPDFKKFITIWVEDVINREVSSTDGKTGCSLRRMEDVLKIGKELK